MRTTILDAFLLCLAACLAVLEPGTCCCLLGRGGCERLATQGGTAVHEMATHSVPSCCNAESTPSRSDGALHRRCACEKTASLISSSGGAPVAWIALAANAVGYFDFRLPVNPAFLVERRSPEVERPPPTSLARLRVLRI